MQLERLAATMVLEKCVGAVALVCMCVCDGFCQSAQQISASELFLHLHLNAAFA